MGSWCVCCGGSGPECRSVNTTGYGGREREDACGNVNVVEGQKEPWRCVSDGDHRVSLRSRMWTRWTGRKMEEERRKEGVQGDRAHVVVQSRVSRSRAFHAASAMVIQRSMLGRLGETVLDQRRCLGARAVVTVCLTE